MSKTIGGVSVSVTVHSPEHLPVKNGEQMYSDDVIIEMRDVIQDTVDTWYALRGCDLLACEPIVS